MQSVVHYSLLHTSVNRPLTHLAIAFNASSFYDMMDTVAQWGVDCVNASRAEMLQNGCEALGRLAQKIVEVDMQKALT